MENVPRWLTPAEACEFARIGRTTLYRLCRKGHIRPRKIGARTLIARAELDAFIDGRVTGLPAIAKGGDR
jgi:excisionase family DNA binding protein